MDDYKQVFQTNKHLQPSSLGYVELLQEEVKRKQDRPLERVQTEEDPDDVSRSPSAHSFHSNANSLTMPYSIPQNLAVSPTLGGHPVSPEIAMGGSRAIQMAVQAHIIKYLLFTQPLNSDSCGIERLLEVREKEQECALAAALADILWTAGEERAATVSLVTPDRCFTPHLDYKLDNFTERALLNLLLTGRASPNVFNGKLSCDEYGNTLEKPLHGVLTRSNVGYLHWSREQAEHASLPAMEHVFHLYFYNGQSTQVNTAMLTIDTHSHHWEAKCKDDQGDPEKRFPSVEMTIRTKWEGAAIDWNGTVPFF
ncbi:Inactive ubiquitin carboxyl-terminal hydrolase MINDY-4B [Bagarius yarrelli]|uniref:Ubiquitin carboxyl-terminal hydrolase MINDY n=1 Tax=Bagarius yarrelli TaxID=175774 RepID=A0A556U7D1_BAGYA|nr:Inactive ubiquitin carboxyl-terminal hydrolase MINDY-4B [Bagarius yarrelli]